MTQVKANLLATMVTESLAGDRAEDVVVINLEGKTTLADYMIIASGASKRQIWSFADHIIEKLKIEGSTTVSVERNVQSDWVLIDAGDVVVHLFRPEVRNFYSLERLWAGEKIDKSSSAIRRVFTAA